MSNTMSAVHCRFVNSSMTQITNFMTNNDTIVCLYSRRMNDNKRTVYFFSQSTYVRINFKLRFSPFDFQIGTAAGSQQRNSICQQ